MHDVIIVGGGAAGMTSAIYAARKMLDLVMISPDVGGQAAWASEVENYLGYKMIQGFDLVMKFEDHVRQFGVNRIDDKVRSIGRIDKIFHVKTEGGQEFESRTVIIATGRSARNLGVPGEEVFKGRGISYCATCDAPLFPDENVAVVGAGNAGLDAAVQLSKIAKQVTIIEESGEVRADENLKARIMASRNVNLLTNTEVVDIMGNALVEGMKIRNLKSKESYEIPIAGVFVEIGSMANTGFLPKYLAMNEHGEVIIDCMNNTNIPGLFAAGDVTNIPGKQIIIAAGEGAKALLSCYKYIVKHFPEAA